MQTKSSSYFQSLSIFLVIYLLFKTLSLLVIRLLDPVVLQMPPIGHGSMGGKICIL
jgi:hypothetical protein